MFICIFLAHNTLIAHQYFFFSLLLYYIAIQYDARQKIIMSSFYLIPILTGAPIFSSLEKILASNPIGIWSIALDFNWILMASWYLFNGYEVSNATRSILARLLNTFW